MQVFKDAYDLLDDLIELEVFGLRFPVVILNQFFNFIDVIIKCANFTHR